MTGKLADRLFLVCGVLAPLALAGFVIAAALLTDDYSGLSDTISQLGIHESPHPLVMNTGFVLCGLLLFGFAFGLHSRLGRGVGARVVRVLLTVGGIGVVLAGVLHADRDVPGAARTLEGDLHNAVAGVAYVALLIVMATFAVVVRRRPSLRGYATMSLAVLAMSVVLLLVYASGAAEPVEGALQLSLFGVTLVWLEAVALRALRRPYDSKSQ
jgi:hypothetical membrane protein